MILLDTDHVSVLEIPDSLRRNHLVARMASTTTEEFGVTIISIEEQMRGWLATIAKEKNVVRQVKAYSELARLFDFFAAFALAHFDEQAARKYEELRVRKIRIATMDLKIASICLVQNALLLTANRQDFEKVPGLRFENWME